MKKSLLLLLFAILISSISRAQVSGSALLCPGFVYTYTANISGAVSYSWTTPVGWQIISGQGTSQIEVMCNLNEGDICADGFDGGGIFIAQNCLTASWGGDGDGWDAQKTSIGSCICAPYSISVQSNGGSSPCGGCGSGTLSPNAVYGVYNDTLPGGTLLGLADGVTAYQPNDTSVISLYVYLIDTTQGMSNAVQITGGTCASTINNEVQLFPCSPPTIVANVTPNPVCLGDTFTVKENSGLGTFPSYHWSTLDSNLSFISANGVDSIQGVFNSASPGNPIVNFTANDVFGCLYIGEITIDVINCIAPPVALFSVDKDSICPGTCVTFMNQSTGAASSLWLFNGAVEDSSILNDPDPVCYSSQGQYSVSLIVSNGGGSDTLTLNNLVHVFPPAAVQNVTLINDTLYSNQGFATYQWYYNNSLIGGATSYYYAATLNGNYTVVSTDANGCESSFEILNVILNTVEANLAGFSIHPNPATSSFEIVFGEFAAKELAIYNSVGEIIFSERISSDKSKFSLDNFTPGIYFVRISSEENFAIKKLIVTE
jgi:PKD repeat protein